jgi:hypothetical protein
MSWTVGDTPAAAEPYPTSWGEKPNCMREREKERERERERKREKEREREREKERKKRERNESAAAAQFYLARVSVEISKVQPKPVEKAETPSLNKVNFSRA